MKYGELVQKHLRMCNFYCTFVGRISIYVQEKVTKTKTKSSSGGGSSAARVSVRRQRH